MNKTAAENIAQEYYLLGQQAALEKKAGLLGKAVKGTGMVYGGIGGMGLPLILADQHRILKGGLSLADRMLRHPDKLSQLLKHSDPGDLLQLGLLSPAAIGGAAIGAGAAGKGIDKLQQLLAKSSK